MSMETPVEGVPYRRLLRGHYDVVVIGNGFRESLLALLCAHQGDTVLHLVFPKAVEELRNHPDASVFSTHDSQQLLADDELSSFTLSQLAGLLHAFVKPTIRLAHDAKIQRVRKTYTCLGKAIPTAAMTLGADHAEEERVVVKRKSSKSRKAAATAAAAAAVAAAAAAADGTATTTTTAGTATTTARDPAPANCNAALTARQLGLQHPRDLFDWNFRLVDQLGLGRPSRGGSPRRPARVHNAARDATHRSCHTTASPLQRYHLSASPMLAPATGGLVTALRAVGALQFLDLAPAGVDCLWLGGGDGGRAGDHLDNPNPGVHAGAHQRAKGMQPAPGNAAAALQCEALGVIGKRRLQLLLELAALCRTREDEDGYGSGCGSGYGSRDSGYGSGDNDRSSDYVGGSGDGGDNVEEEKEVEERDGSSSSSSRGTARRRKLPVFSRDAGLRQQLLAKVAACAQLRPAMNTAGGHRAAAAPLPLSLAPPVLSDATSFGEFLHTVRRARDVVFGLSRGWQSR
jgi:hypothetical protein